MREKVWSVTRPVVRHADVACAAAPVPSAGAACAGARDERVAVIRRRVREGAYEARDVVERVGRRILERGDL